MRRFTASAAILLVCLGCGRQETTVLNLRDFGAVGNGVADDGPALQRALEALAAAGGGTLEVPPGRYAIATPVSKDFAGKVRTISIRGAPSGRAINVAGRGSGLKLTSELLIRVGKGQVALGLAQLEALSIQDIAFVGRQDVADDARVVLQVNGVEHARIEHCEFYGLASLQPGGAIVAAHQSGLVIDSTAFLGCATSSANSTSVVQSTDWKELTVTHTKFVDYGNRPNFYSKTPLAPPYAWIRIGDAAEREAEGARRNAVLRHLFLDEGALIGISTGTASHVPFSVFISEVRMNVSNLASVGIYLAEADQVLIEKTHLGWSHNANAAIVLKGIRAAILDRVECVDAAHTIRADDATGMLVVLNSTYETLDSAALVSKAITTRNPMDDPVQYVRKQYSAVLKTEPSLPELHFRAEQLLRCGDDASCLGAARAALVQDLAARAPK